MIKIDLHMHTSLCDGKNTAEEMILSAIQKGFNCVGISGHSYTHFDESYCMSRENTEKYKSNLAWLKRKYAKKINVLCGIEQDFYSEEPLGDYDYVIGSVHYLKVNDSYIPVDESAEILKKAVSEHFSGDWYKLTQLYYQTEADVVERTECNIIGHFDLITKFNENDALFSTRDERYVKQWKAAMDKLLEADKTFEINTGAISRGYRSSAYPSEEIIAYIKEHGGKLILSSDAHASENIGYLFDRYEKFIDDRMIEL